IRASPWFDVDGSIPSARRTTSVPSCCARRRYAMAVQTRLVDYSAAGLTCRGLLAWDDAHSGPRPAVAIAHTWGGRSDFEAGRAKALAELGYLGFALDLYGGGRQGGSPEANAELMQPLLRDRALLQDRMSAGIAALRELPEADPGRIAAIGYCFGGLCVLDLARTGA